MNSIAALIYLLSPLAYARILPLPFVYRIIVGQVLAWAGTIGYVHLNSIFGRNTSLVETALIQIPLVVLLRFFAGVSIRKTPKKEKGVGQRTLTTSFLLFIPVALSVLFYGIRIVPVPSSSWDMTVHYRMMQSVYELGHINDIAHYPFGFHVTSAYFIRAIEAILNSHGAAVHLSAFAGYIYLLYVLIIACIDAVINPRYRQSAIISLLLSLIASILVSYVHLPILYQGFISVYFFLIPFLIYGLISSGRFILPERLRGVLYFLLFYLMGISYWYYAPVFGVYLLYRIGLQRQRIYVAAAIGYGCAAFMGILPFLRVSGYGALVVGSYGYFMQPGTVFGLLVITGFSILVRFRRHFTHLSSMGLLCGLFAVTTLLLVILGKGLQLYSAYKMAIPVFVVCFIYLFSYMHTRIICMKSVHVWWSVIVAIGVCTYALLSYQAPAGLVSFAGGGFNFFRNNTQQLSAYIEWSSKSKKNTLSLLPVESEPRSMHWGLLILNASRSPLLICMNPKQTEPQYRSCIQKSSMQIARSGKAVRWVDTQKLLLRTCNRELFTVYKSDPSQHTGLAYGDREFREYCGD